MAGSDQIWNYEFPGRFGDYEIHSMDYFLTFADKNKRNSLSASFGITSIKTEWRQKYRTWLNSFKNLSVREKTAANIIQELTGRTAKILIDPTMSITADEWRKISSKPKDIDFSEPYLLEYFLDANASRENDIQNMAAKLHIKRYKLWDVAYEDLFLVGPDEFLYLIDHAELICTDSYHATIFSILFEKPFVVYERGNMNSRIDTLLQMFRLEGRKSVEIEEDHIMEISFDVSNQVLETKRNEYKKYIQHIINGN